MDYGHVGLGFKTKAIGLLYFHTSMLQHKIWMFINTDPMNGELYCKGRVQSKNGSTGAVDQAFLLYNLIHFKLFWEEHDGDAENQKSDRIERRLHDPSGGITASRLRTTDATMKEKRVKLC